MKHKYTITVEAPYVKGDTEQLVRAVAKRSRAEFLGCRVLKGGDFQAGVSCEAKLMKDIRVALDSTCNGNVLYRDMGVDDGKRKAAPKAEAAPKVEAAKPSKPRPQPKPPQPTREAVCAGIPPTDDQFHKWDRLGSPAHKRAVELLGAGCEERSMKWWGRFSISRDRLFEVLCNRLRGDKAMNDYITSARVSEGFGKVWDNTWRSIAPLVRKAFTEEEYAFIEWHTTHSGRRP